MTLPRLAMIAGGFAAASAAVAYPEGAPWGAANPAARETCASCHFDSEAIAPSDALRLSGLPDNVEPSTEHLLELILEDAGAISAGFQVLALTDQGDAGTFIATSDDVEAVGAAIRSTAVQREAKAVWSFTWRAPATVSAPIVFLLAATAGNDDGSPLGDRVHFQRQTTNDAAAKK